MHTLVSAGDLDQRILLRVRSDAPDAGVGATASYTAGMALWARVEPVHGLALRAAAQVEEVPTHLVWVRAGASIGTRVTDITQAHVIDWAGRRLRVIDAIGAGERFEFTRISATDLGPAT